MTINIKGLTVEFNNGTKAIDNLNLNIESFNNNIASIKRKYFN